ncbi:hypothetical protein [Xanthobacter flavus]|uniref:hypothetical protein n=1 Tax=Xanthobacter flavus TaxID=281 RepID=UPI00372CE2BA
MTEWNLGSRPKPFAPAPRRPAIAAAFFAGECAIVGLLVVLVAGELSPSGGQAGAFVPAQAVVLAAWLFTTALLMAVVCVSALLEERRAHAPARRSERRRQ